MSSERYHRPVQGFTLIEVLIALAVIAISLGAILSTSGSQASQAAYLKHKTIAHWVAMNELAQLQIENSFPDIGETTGSTEMARTEWYWKRTTLKTEDDDARQVEFQVFSDKNHDNNLIRLTGYVNK